MLQTIINFKKDLDFYTDGEVLSIAKMYNLSGSPNDLRWIISIRHTSQNAQMLSGGVMSFVEKLPILIPVFKTRGENIAINKNYVDKLLQLIREQKEFKKNLRKMSMADKRKRELELNQTETNLKRQRGWETIQKIRQLFDKIPQQYFDWTIKSYIDGSINRLEDILSRLKPAIDDFAWLKKNNKIAKEIDIRKLNGLVGLEDFLDDYEDELQSRHKMLEELESAREEGKLIYDGKDIKIIQPLTKAGACYYGKGTKWCTAATKAENPFDHYNKIGPMYIIQPKNPKREGKEKYQLHFETAQFMDENDKKVDMIKLFKQYPEIEALRDYAPKFTFDILKDEIQGFADVINRNNITSNDVQEAIDRLKMFNLDFNKILQRQDISDHIKNFDIKISVEDAKTLVTLSKVGLLSKIRKIDLVNESYKVFGFISKNITEFTKLTKLIINSSNITEIPDNISLLNLKILDLGSNSIIDIPHSIGNMKNLEILLLSDNKIKEIPDTLTKLKNLKVLDLSLNIIKTIPKSIGDMQSLEELILLSNLIESIPDTISNLSNLEILDISANKVTDIPESILKMEMEGLELEIDMNI